MRKFTLKIEPLLKKERENGFEALTPNTRELIGLADAIDLKNLIFELQIGSFDQIS